MPILQINFKLNVSTDEYRKICDAVAEPIADVPGLQWKVWLLNERENEAGGVYLFRDEKALDDYLSGAIVAQIESHPAIKEFSVKRFDVMDAVTAVTRGPIPTWAAAA
jgi:hypothetical protein